MKILNHYIIIRKVNHPDKPKTKVYEWIFKVTQPALDIKGGYANTLNNAQNDASITLYDHVKKHNLL
jgi:hypothetical protein